MERATLARMPSVTPFLWFDKQAEEAANLYVSIFPNSKITQKNPMTVSFELDGRAFIALNGGPHFQFNEAVSFMIDCVTQEDVDHYWSRLTADGGQEGRCGWLKDKFGVSWQVVPRRLGELLQDPDRERAGRAMQAMMQMKKIDIAALERAASGV
jgi:predicted 3-demethylubiquinone-9 3-methyltransferase (glyoxalase superfamily)